LQAVYVSHPRNVLYLTGAEAGRLLITRRTATLWVRDLYIGVYKSLYEGDYPYSVEPYEKCAVKRKVQELRLRRIGVENSSANYVKSLRKNLKARISVVDAVENLRAVKSAYELKQLRKAAAVADAGMMRAAEVVTGGASEQEAIAEVEYVIRKMGSQTPPFEGGMILASGARGADIHAKSSAKKIGRGLVVVDLGACVNGYHSDMTRTLTVGSPTRREEEALELVRQVRDDAVGRVVVGARAADIHSFVEERLSEKGYRFYHSTGHGVGLEVHERPNVGPKSKDVFKENMVLTIEPGVYVPARFGVRFEDTVWLSPEGPKVLTGKTL